MKAVVVQALAHPDAGCLAPARLGFTVTKKVGNAVVRNRVRRRLRAAARLVLKDRPASGVDLVLIGRAATIACPFATLTGDLERAFVRLGVEGDPPAGTPSA